MHDDHVVNPELIKLAVARLRKRAFVPGGDPSMGGGGGMPPPGDPSMGGGMPPMDPSMMGGMPPGDPSMGGGMPPMDPAMMGGGMPPPPPPPSGGDTAGLGAKLDQLIQLMQGGAVGAQSGANAAGQIKPKIDINVEILKMNKILARIADALGVHIPAYEMVATPQDLTAMAHQQQSQGQQDASMGGAIGQMAGMDPMQGAGVPGPPKQAAARPYRERGEAFNGPALTELGDKAAAVHQLMRARRR